MLFLIIKGKISKGLISLVFYFIHGNLILRNRFKIHFLRQHLKCVVEGKLLDKDSKDFAIVALFPRRELLKSSRRLIDNLISQNFHPVVVLNESKDRDLFLSEFKDLNHEITILSRRNIGRDFGAYKCAIEVLERNVGLRNIRKLAFFNDSIFYGKNFSWFNKLVDSDSGVAALYSNFEFNPHFQSMAFICNEDVLKSETFKSFWKTYFPSEIRVKVIKNGELKLSKTVLKAGFSFSDLSTEILFTETKTMNLMEKQALLMFALDLHPQKNLLKNILTVPKFPIKDNLPLTKNAIADLINLAITSKNVSHALGAYFTRNYGFPLKLDLIKFGTIGIKDFYKLMNETRISEQEIQDLVFFARTNGSFYGLSGWNKLFRDYHLS